MNTLRPRKRIGQQRAPHGPGRLDLLPCPAKRMHDRGAHFLLMPWPVQIALVFAYDAAIRAALAQMKPGDVHHITNTANVRHRPPERAGVRSGRPHGV